jgi:FMN reductase
MTTRTLAVISGGLSVPSSTRLLADQIDAATTRALRELDIEPSSQVIELRTVAHDVTNNLLTGFPSAELGAAVNTVCAADGLVVVSPIFKASYGGLVKSFFDVLEDDALAGKPVLVAATGGSSRHSLALDHALRPLFAYFQAVVVPTGVFAASDDWGRGDSVSPTLGHRVDRAARELAELVARSTKPARLDPFDEPTPFEQLLAGG